jgi:hypothetical protein
MILPGNRGDFASAVADEKRSGIAARLEPNGVAYITLNRPDQLNALDFDLASALLELTIRASEDTNVRCLVLTGNEKAFCAGDDISAVECWMNGDRKTAPFDQCTSDAIYLRVCEAIIEMPKPVIACLTGATAGAGLDIACAADYRLCSTNARIGSGVLKIGHVGNAVLLPRVVGPAKATEIYITGRMLNSKEALRIGLVDRIVAQLEIEKVIDELANHFAQLPTKSIGLFKQLRERAWGQPVQYGLRLQDSIHLVTHDHVNDSIEGIRAFRERRTPDFRGI